MDLSKIYDPYKINARIKPAFLLFLPVVIFVIAFLSRLVRWKVLR